LAGWCHCESAASYIFGMNTWTHPFALSLVSFPDPDFSERGLGTRLDTNVYIYNGLLSSLVQSLQQGSLWTSRPYPKLCNETNYWKSSSHKQCTTAPESWFDNTEGKEADSHNNSSEMLSSGLCASVHVRQICNKLQLRLATITPEELTSCTSKGRIRISTNIVLNLKVLSSITLSPNR